MARMTVTPWRFAVFDDGIHHRPGLIAALGHIPGAVLVADGPVDDDAIVSVTALRPDFVLASIYRPTSERLEVVRALRRHWPNGRLVLVIPRLPPFPEWWLADARRIGVSDFTLYTDSTASLLLKAVGDLVPAESTVDALTVREREVADLVGQGLLDKEVARILAISESTVGNHLRSIFAKLGLNNRRELILRSVDGAGIERTREDGSADVGGIPWNWSRHSA